MSEAGRRDVYRRSVAAVGHTQGPAGLCVRCIMSLCQTRQGGGESAALC